MKFLLLLPFLGGLLLLSGCLYDHPPSKPASQIDTWLLGDWEAQDQNGKNYSATLTPKDNTHYHVTFYDQSSPSEFEGWISRVGKVKFLTLRSLNPSSPQHKKYLFLYYEMLQPTKPPINGVGTRQIRIKEPQLASSARSLDSYHLRQSIQKALNKGTLLAPTDGVIWRKTELED